MSFVLPIPRRMIFRDPNISWCKCNQRRYLAPPILHLRGHLQSILFRASHSMDIHVTEESTVQEFGPFLPFLLMLNVESKNEKMVHVVYFSSDTSQLELLFVLLQPLQMIISPPPFPSPIQPREIHCRIVIVSITTVILVCTIVLQNSMVGMTCIL